MDFSHLKSGTYAKLKIAKCMNKYKVNDENHISVDVSVMNQEEFKSNITQMKSQSTIVTKSKANRYNFSTFSSKIKKDEIIRSDQF